MANAEMQAAMTMTNTGIEAVSRIIAALIELAGRNSNNAKEQETLKGFQKHVSNGGQLLSLPASREYSAEFEAELEKSNIPVIKVNSKHNEQLVTYIFRDTDKSNMDIILTRLKDNGVEMIDSQYKTFDFMVNYAGMDRLSNISIDKEEAGKVMLELDIHQIPYTYTNTEDRYSIIIGTQDSKLLMNFPETRDYEVKDLNAKTTLKEIKQKAESQSKTDTQSKEKSVERTM